MKCSVYPVVKSEEEAGVFWGEEMHLREMEQYVQRARALRWLRIWKIWKIRELVYGEEVGWAILQMRTLKAKGGELSKVSQFLFCQLKERCLKEITLPFPKSRQVLMPPNTVFPSIFWQIGLISPPNSLHYLETLAILMTIISWTKTYSCSADSKG